MTEPLLQVRGLCKAFGALVVTDHLDLDLAAGETLAVIGPNGAGKSTLVAQLAGDVRPDAGSIAFAGRSLAHESPDARARLGVARSFQITTVVPSFSAEDNVALAVQGRAATRMRFWGAARSDEALRAPARAALERVGLSARAAERAADLSHGEARVLEIAMALACEPALLLLDEPMAGMGHDESRAMIELLRSIKSGTTILLIEHDMEAVAQLADRVMVLVAGPRWRAARTTTCAATRWCATPIWARTDAADRRPHPAGYGETPVLFEVSFEIAAGEALALVGRNGMGKTTTMRAILGLCPPGSGTVTFDGRPLAGLAPFPSRAWASAGCPKGV